MLTRRQQLCDFALDIPPFFITEKLLHNFHEIDRPDLIQSSAGLPYIESVIIDVLDAELGE